MARRALASILLAVAFLLPSQGAGAEATPPASEAVPELPFQSFRLENGLTVILHEDHTAPIVGVHVQYDVGSKEEKAGRTGFAHLFEHLMFQGTANLPKGEADRLIEAAGGASNGSTSQDTTQYWEQVPSNALETMLFIQSERMGFLLPTLDQAKLDNQREVVRNERRQNYEMRPYGLAFKAILENVWNPEFPYHWLPIGTHEDLEAATLVDVKEFFERWYGPENAILSLAGDLEPAKTRALVEKWFGGIPGGERAARATPAPKPLQGEKRVTIEDTVQLPRLYLAWQTPRLFAPGDAALDVLSHVLAGNKSARLVKRLVMEERIAQDVSASQASNALASMYLVVATPKPGIGLDRIEREIDEELARIAKTPPTQAELDRAKVPLEAGMIFSLEPLGGFGGRAATLANYYLRAGDPGWFDEDLGRYRAITAEDVSEAARRYLAHRNRVALTVVPRAAAPAAPAPAPAPAPATSSTQGTAR